MKMPLMLLAILVFLAPAPGAITEPSPIPIPQNGETVLEENFAKAPLARGWSVRFSEWYVEDGVFRARPLAADNHAAAARRALPMQDGIYRLRFYLLLDQSAFHYGFNPARGELDKRGHLFSLIVTPQKTKLMKHADKDRTEEDIDVSETEIETGMRHTGKPSTESARRLSLMAASTRSTGRAIIPLSR